MTEAKTQNTTNPSRINRQIFGSLMRKLRTDADVSRAEFAKRVGFSGPLISQTESGVNPPNAAIEAYLVELYPAQEATIRRLAGIARLSSGSHAQDFQNYITWNLSDHAAHAA